MAEERAGGAVTEEEYWAEENADIELSDPFRGVPPREEPDCYSCCDRGCMECDGSIEGPRLPWWWTVVEPWLRPSVTVDEDGEPYLDGQPLFQATSEEAPF